jgi:hypothetical protein
MKFIAIFCFVLAFESAMAAHDIMAVFWLHALLIFMATFFAWLGYITWNVNRWVNEWAKENKP